MSVAASPFPWAKVIIAFVGWMAFSCCASAIGGITSVSLGMRDTVLSNPFLYNSWLLAFVVHYNFFNKRGYLPYLSALLGMTCFINWLIPLTGLPNALFTIFISSASFIKEKNPWSVIGLIGGFVGLFATLANSALGLYLYYAGL